MSLVEDYIKNRLTPNAPDFSQYKPKANPTPMLGEVKGNEGMPKAPTFTQQEYRGRVIPTPPQQKPIPNFASMADQNSWKEMPEDPLVTKVKGGADPYEALLENYYKESKEDLERRRKASMLGDLAQLFGQSINLGIGARQFNPIKSDTAQYTGALQNLQDAYRKYGLNYKMREILANKDAERQGALDEAKFKRDLYTKEIEHRQRMGEIDARTAGRLKEALLKVQSDRDLKKFEQNEEWKRAIYKEKNANYRHTHSGGATGKQPKTISVRLNKEDGTPYTIHVPENYKGSIASLYKDIQREIRKNPDKYDKLEDAQIGIGEGGTQESKMLAIVLSRIHEFPQLYPALQSIISDADVTTDEGQTAQGTAPAAQTAQKGGTSLLPGVKAPAATTAATNTTAAKVNPKGSMLPMSADNVTPVTPAAPKAEEKPQSTQEKYSSKITKAATDRRNEEAEAKARAVEEQLEKERKEREEYLAAKERVKEITPQIQDFNNYDIHEGLENSGLDALDQHGIYRDWQKDNNKIKELKAENARLRTLILNYESKHKQK